MRGTSGFDPFLPRGVPLPPAPPRPCVSPVLEAAARCSMVASALALAAILAMAAL